jgi:uncharacterized membrane protein YfcA
MGILLLVGLAGFTASLIDNSLGMGFGPTSSTVLLAAGLTPAATSTTVNLAKVVVGVAGGTSHWRFGNVDRRLVWQLAVPGCAGAVLGVTVLANVDGDRIRPYLAMLLLVVGLRILIRFSRPVRRADGVADAGTRPAATATGDFNRRGIGAIAVAGGLTNGLIGAWGPVVTPALLHRDGLEPRIAVGSVNVAEIAVALTASVSLLASLGGAGVDAATVVAMLLGGAIAAPIAAWVTRHLPPRVLGGGVAVLLLTTNVRELAGWAGIGTARWLIYMLVLALSLLAMVRPPLAARVAARPSQRVGSGTSQIADHA